jgi:multidrug efflux system membrane fusion protein
MAEPSYAANDTAEPSEPGRAPPAAPSPTHRRRSWLRWLLFALAVVLIGWLLWTFVLHPKKPPAPAPRPVPVSVAKVTSGDMHVVLRGIGTVTPAATITVQTQISGLLMKVGFKEGQLVHKGQLLDLIDPRPYEIALAQAEGTLKHDQGLLAEARVDLARYQVLAAQNSIARQTAEDQQFVVDQDEGTVLTDEATVRSDKLNIAYCHITAPVTGRVGLRLVDAGNYVQAGSSTGLAVVTQLQPITVIFVLPEDAIPAVAQQLGADPNLVVAAWDRQNSKEIARGRLLTIDNTVDTTTGTVKLRASFPNTDFALFPNEFVNGRLLLKTLQNVTEVPARAIQRGAPGTFVYLVKPDDTVAVQVIRTGVADGDKVQVLAGLTAGQTVVVDGVDQLHPGAKVRAGPAGRVHAPTPNNGPGAAPGEEHETTQAGANGQAQG